MVSVTTNGYFLPDRHEALAEADAVVISLDAAEAGIHDAMRGLPGLHERALRGIGILRQRYPRIRVAINSVLTRHNRGQVEPILRMSERLGIRLLRRALGPATRPSIACGVGVREDLSPVASAEGFGPTSA